jgi:phage protein D
MPLIILAPAGCTVELDGSPVDAAVLGQMESATVVDRLTAPDTFALVFRDPMVDVIGRAGFEIGKAVRILAGGPYDGSDQDLIEAEITGIEADCDASGMRVVVRGYDKSHRLASGRRTATYQGMSLTDIVKQVASNAGLNVDADATSGTLDHVLQANQSDLDFLYAIAARAGYDLRMSGDTLLFKKPIASTTAPDSGDVEAEDPVQLVFGANLLEFRGRMSAVAQVSEVQVKGWDPKTKKGVTGKATPSATHAPQATTPASLAKKVGGGQMVVVNHEATDQATADRLAQARAEQVGSAAFEATAVTLGDPALKAGTAVSVMGVDPALCGQWVISGSRHEFNLVTGYRTTLDFSGRQDRSIMGLITQGAGAAGSNDRMPGAVIATVDDIDDPDALGRVRVQYPWMGADAVSFWARLAAQGAGADSGVAWLPQAGDEVLVLFEQGDPGRPIVVAGLWNGSDTFPQDKIDGIDGGKVKGCGFISRSGHRIVFFEKDYANKIEIATSDDKLKIVMDGASGAIEIEADGDIKIKAGGAMNLEAGGNMTIKGSTVALN